MPDLFFCDDKIAYMLHFILIFVLWESCLRFSNFSLIRILLHLVQPLLPPRLFRSYIKHYLLPSGWNLQLQFTQRDTYLSGLLTGPTFIISAQGAMATVPRQRCSRALSALGGQINIPIWVATHLSGHCKQAKILHK